MSAQKPPNILFIMDDQHRFDYLRCAGADFVRTPNIDRLAARGMHFSHCCTNAPMCAPARISLATGIQPFRMGNLDNNCYLPVHRPTYYQHLRDHGYRVGCVGKLDLAKPDLYNGRNGDRPPIYQWGFTDPEECEGKVHAAVSPQPHGPYGAFLQEQGLFRAFQEDYASRAGGGGVVGVSHDSVLPTEAFQDVYIGQQAVRWLENTDDDFPWHYFVSFVGPHDPFDPPNEYAARTRDAAVPPAIEDDFAGKPEWVRRKAAQFPADATEVAHIRRQYCASIEVIDTQIGHILDAVEARGELDNTYIIFASDHGEMLGDHGLFLKHVAYEPSLRVPLIIAGPAINPGAASDALVELLDLNATITELAGLPAQPNLDARSLAPVLFGDRANHREEALVTYRNFRAVRTERFKCIENYNDRFELYDLENDPEERQNIADERPEVVDDCRARIKSRTREGRWLR